MDCPSPDYSPGGCGRINLARTLDYLAQLDRWSALVVAECEIGSGSGS